MLEPYIEEYLKGLANHISTAEGTDTDTAASYGIDSGYDVGYGYKQYGDNPLSSISIKDLLTLQGNNNKFAAGKFQVKPQTLLENYGRAGLTEDSLFNEDAQDEVLKTLLKGRGFEKFLAGDMTEEEFAYNLSKEWASLPKDAGGRSYYGDDGVNHSETDWGETLQVLVDTREAWNAGGEQNNLDTWKGFYTDHPMRIMEDGSKSNVVMSSMSDEEWTYVVPTMMRGKLYTPEEAWEIHAGTDGRLSTLPRFKKLEDAEAWIEENHGRIAADGTWESPALKLHGEEESEKAFKATAVSDEEKYSWLNKEQAFQSEAEAQAANLLAGNPKQHAAILGFAPINKETGVTSAVTVDLNFKNVSTDRPLTPEQEAIVQQLGMLDQDIKDNPTPTLEEPISEAQIAEMRRMGMSEEDIVAFQQQGTEKLLLEEGFNNDEDEDPRIQQLEDLQEAYLELPQAVGTPQEEALWLDQELSVRANHFLGIISELEPDAAERVIAQLDLDIRGVPQSPRARAALLSDEFNQNMASGLMMISAAFNNPNELDAKGLAQQMHNQIGVFESDLGPSPKRRGMSAEERAERDSMGRRNPQDHYGPYIMQWADSTMKAADTFFDYTGSILQGDNFYVYHEVQRDRQALSDFMGIGAAYVIPSMKIVQGLKVGLATYAGVKTLTGTGYMALWAISGGIVDGNLAAKSQTNLGNFIEDITEDDSFLHMAASLMARRATDTNADASAKDIVAYGGLGLVSQGLIQGLLRLKFRYKYPKTDEGTRRFVMEEIIEPYAKAVKAKYPRLINTKENPFHSIELQTEKAFNEATEAGYKYHMPTKEQIGEIMDYFVKRERAAARNALPSGRGADRPSISYDGTRIPLDSFPGGMDSALAHYVNPIQIPIGHLAHSLPTLEDFQKGIHNMYSMPGPLFNEFKGVTSETFNYLSKNRNGRLSDAVKKMGLTHNELRFSGIAGVLREDPMATNDDGLKHWENPELTVSHTQTGRDLSEHYKPLGGGINTASEDGADVAMSRSDMLEDSEIASDDRSHSKPGYGPTAAEKPITEAEHIARYGSTIDLDSLGLPHLVNNGAISLAWGNAKDGWTTPVGHAGSGSESVVTDVQHIIPVDNIMSHGRLGEEAHPGSVAGQQRKTTAVIKEMQMDAQTAATRAKKDLAQLTSRYGWPPKMPLTPSISEAMTALEKRIAVLDHPLKNKEIQRTALQLAQVAAMNGNDSIRVVTPTEQSRIQGSNPFSQKLYEPNGQINQALKKLAKKTGMIRVVEPQTQGEIDEAARWVKLEDELDLVLKGSSSVKSGKGHDKTLLDTEMYVSEPSDHTVDADGVVVVDYDERAIRVTVVTEYDAATKYAPSAERVKIQIATEGTASGRLNIPWKTFYMKPEGELRPDGSPFKSAYSPTFTRDLMAEVKRGLEMDGLGVNTTPKIRYDFTPESRQMLIDGERSMFRLYGGLHPEQLKIPEMMELLKKQAAAFKEWHQSLSLADEALHIAAKEKYERITAKLLGEAPLSPRELEDKSVTELVEIAELEHLKFDYDLGRHLELIPEHLEPWDKVKNDSNMQGYANSGTYALMEAYSIDNKAILKLLSDARYTGGPRKATKKKWEAKISNDMMLGISTDVPNWNPLEDASLTVRNFYRPFAKALKVKGYSRLKREELWDAIQAEYKHVTTGGDWKTEMVELIVSARSTALEKALKTDWTTGVSDDIFARGRRRSPVYRWVASWNDAYMQWQRGSDEHASVAMVEKGERAFGSMQARADAILALTNGRVDVSEMYEYGAGEGIIERWLGSIGFNPNADPGTVDVIMEHEARVTVAQRDIDSIAGRLEGEGYGDVIAKVEGGVKAEFLDDLDKAAVERAVVGHTDAKIESVGEEAKDWFDLGEAEKELVTVEKVAMEDQAIANEMQLEHIGDLQKQVEVLHKNLYKAEQLDENELRSALSTIEGLESKVASLEKSASTNVDAVTRMAEHIKELDKAVGDLLKKWVKAGSLSESPPKLTEDVEVEIISLKAELDNLKAEKETVKASMDGTPTAVHKKLSSDVKRVKNQIEKLRKKLDTKSTAEEIQLKVENLEEQMATLLKDKGVLEAEHGTRLDGAIDYLQNKLDDIKGLSEMLDTASGKINPKKSAVAELQRALEEFERVLGAGGKKKGPSATLELAFARYQKLRAAGLDTKAALHTRARSIPSAKAESDEILLWSKKNANQGRWNGSQIFKHLYKTEFGGYRGDVKWHKEDNFGAFESYFDDHGLFGNASVRPPIISQHHVRGVGAMVLASRLTSLVTGPATLAIAIFSGVTELIWRTGIRGLQVPFLKQLSLQGALRTEIPGNAVNGVLGVINRSAEYTQLSKLPGIKQMVEINYETMININELHDWIKLTEEIQAQGALEAMAKRPRRPLINAVLTPAKGIGVPGDPSNDNIASERLAMGNLSGETIMHLGSEVDVSTLSLMGEITSTIESAWPREFWMAVVGAKEAAVREGIGSLDYYLQLAGLERTMMEAVANKILNKGYTKEEGFTMVKALRSLDNQLIMGDIGGNDIIDTLATEMGVSKSNRMVYDALAARASYLDLQKVASLTQNPPGWGEGIVELGGHPIAGHIIPYAKTSINTMHLNMSRASIAGYVYSKFFTKATETPMGRFNAASNALIGTMLMAAGKSYADNYSERMELNEFGQVHYKLPWARKDLKHSIRKLAKADHGWWAKAMTAYNSENNTNYDINNGDGERERFLDDMLQGDTFYASYDFSRAGVADALIKVGVYSNWWINGYAPGVDPEEFKKRGTGDHLYQIFDILIGSYGGNAIGGAMRLVGGAFDDTASVEDAAIMIMSDVLFMAKALQTSDMWGINKHLPFLPDPYTGKRDMELSGETFYEKVMARADMWGYTELTRPRFDPIGDPYIRNEFSWGVGTVSANPTTLQQKALNLRLNFNYTEQTALGPKPLRKIRTKDFRDVDGTSVYEFVHRQAQVEADPFNSTPGLLKDAINIYFTESDKFLDAEKELLALHHLFLEGKGQQMSDDMQTKKFKRMGELQKGIREDVYAIRKLWFRAAGKRVISDNYADADGMTLTEAIRQRDL